MNIGKALPADGWPLGSFIEEVTVWLEPRRLLLLIYDLENQTDEADEHKAKLKKLRVCDQSDHPLPKRTRGQEVSPPCKGANRLPLLAAPGSRGNRFYCSRPGEVCQSVPKKTTPRPLTGGRGVI